MLNRRGLREEALRVRDKISGDPFHFFPEWARKADKASLPRMPLIYLSGDRDHARWLFLRHEGTLGLDRVAIVEPRRPGLVILGQKTIGIQELLKLVAQLRDQGKEFLCIDFSMEHEDHLLYKRIARSAGIKILDWAAAFRLPVFEELQSGPINDLITGLLEDFDSTLEIGPLLADELSQMTLYSILLFRMTLKREYLWPVSVSMASEYFFSGLFELGDDEVFLDVGAFSGDTLETFTSVTGGRFRKYYGFEPSPANFGLLVSTRNRLRLANAVLEQKAVSSGAGEVTFAAHWGMGSRMVPEDDVGVSRATRRPRLPWYLKLLTRRRPPTPVAVVPTVSIDDYFRDKEPVTFLKLDVEGAEMSALEGARELLVSQRPKLAISAYHLPTDLHDICRFIAELGVGYRIAIRHHNTSHWDTVVYACANGSASVERETV